jgi:hypothetical protein
VELVSLTIDDDATPLTTAPMWLAEWVVSHVDRDELLEAVPDGLDPDEARERAAEDRESFRNLVWEE